MYTVLLVDDESTVLDTLVSTVHWQHFGVNDVLTATDGLQAVEIMASQKVDLLITDIKMPQMDGLSLISEVRTRFPHTHCILLTAYGEFEYARRAIQLGVENYLLKPLPLEELEETIEKALDNIYSHKKSSTQLFKENILARWVNGNISSEELSERASIVDINLYLPEYCVVCITKKHSSIALSNFCKICAESLSLKYETHFFQDDRNRYIFIIGGSHIVENDLIAHIVGQSAKMELSDLIVISVGTVVQDTSNLFESWQMASSLIDSADLSVSGLSVLTQEDSSAWEETKLMQDLNIAFHNREEESRNSCFIQLAESLLEISKNHSPQKAIKLLSHSLSRLFSNEFPKHPEALDQISQRLHLLVPSAENETLSNSIVELLQYGNLLFNYYYQQLSPITQTAIHYIHSHYMNGISIKEFCAKNKMSTPYLGYLFKKETGLFFNNYLMQYRICASVRLLLDTNQTINDIAVNVGFSSTSYYILCFKKQTGLSPIKYRSTQI